MDNQMANAFPRKAFFAQMFTRDISLEGCILDLIDNSIDGLIRTERKPLSEISNSIFRRKTWKKTISTHLPVIRVSYSQDDVMIQDNCGGIDLKYALQEAFNFGHGSDKPPDSFFGAYGIGLKRALFKIGKHFFIKSQTIKTGFTCELDIDKWLAKDDDIEDWKIPLEVTNGAKTKESAGTYIKITKLHDEVKLRIKSGDLNKPVYNEIQKAYSLFLKDFVQIEVNRQRVEPVTPPAGKLKKPSFEEFEEGNVKVRIIATVAHSDQDGQFDQKMAGWYIVCNGRVILAADKSERSGWGISPMPSFHPKYRAFIGYVFFESENPLLLPWTTTKRDLNKESLIFLHVKDKMTLAARPVLSFINRMYPSDPDTEPIERMISQEAKEASISDLISKKRTIFSPGVPEKPTQKTTTKVQYEAEKSDLEKIKKHLRKPKMGASGIGRYTFDYFLRNEGLK